MFPHLRFGILNAVFTLTDIAALLGNNRMGRDDVFGIGFRVRF